jgi:hypothetical protein
MVGRVIGSTIFIDPTAAGHGRYVDSTRGNDSEFEIRNSPSR